MSLTAASKMDRPTGSSHLNFSLAALFMGGGIGGYAKAKSVPSLVGGLACSAAFLASGFLINSGEPEKGYGLGLGTSTLIAAGFGARAIKSAKPVPASLAILGVVGAAYNFKKYQDCRT